MKPLTNNSVKGKIKEQKYIKSLPMYFRLNKNNILGIIELNKRNKKFETIFNNVIYNESIHVLFFILSCVFIILITH